MSETAQPSAHSARAHDNIGPSTELGSRAQHLPYSSLCTLREARSGAARAAKRAAASGQAADAISSRGGAGASFGGSPHCRRCRRHLCRWPSARGRLYQARALPRPCCPRFTLLPW